jgi:hypothetical protein
MCFFSGDFLNNPVTKKSITNILCCKKIMFLLEIFANFPRKLFWWKISITIQTEFLV